MLRVVPTKHSRDFDSGSSVVCSAPARFDASSLQNDAGKRIRPNQEVLERLHQQSSLRTDSPYASIPSCVNNNVSMDEADTSSSYDGNDEDMYYVEKSPRSRVEFNQEQSIAKRKKLQKKDAPQEPLYNLKQVHEIVNKMVAQKEAQLRMEYDKILQEKLNEQYHQFNQYLEDCISRRMKENDFSYLS